MKKTIIILCFIGLFFTGQSQELFKSYNYNPEIVDYEYKISDKLLKEAMKRISFNKTENVYVYADSEGYVTVGDHDRVTLAVYDKNLNWYETRIYYTPGEYTLLGSKNRKAKAEYKSAIPKITDVVNGAGYLMPADLCYTKVINKEGYWYEILAHNDSELVDFGYKLFILDGDFNLVRVQDVD